MAAVLYDGYDGLEKSHWYDYGFSFYDPALGRWQFLEFDAEIDRSWSHFVVAFPECSI